MSWLHSHPWGGPSSAVPWGQAGTFVAGLPQVFFSAAFCVESL